jgi:sigma-B regulation protein RsbU (phosphoserine phosphatase)
MELPRNFWTYTVLTGIGLVFMVFGMGWRAPDVAVRLADADMVLERARRDAERVGCRVAGEPSLQVSAGYRMDSTAGEVQALAEQVADPAERRRRLRQVPPVRLSARFHQVVGPQGNPGSLLLEYDAEGRLVGISFGLGGVQAVDFDAAVDRRQADALAEVLLGEPPPIPEMMEKPGQYELLYHPGNGRPNAYVFLGGGMWLAHLQPAPHWVISGSSLNFLSWHPTEQAQITVLLLVSLLSLGILLWRLGRQRAGLGQALPVLGLLLLGLLPVVKHYHSGDPRLLGALWLYLLLTQLGIWLGWAAAEAELRDVRPRALEPWDRILRRRPLARNGVDLLRGLACGVMLGGWLAVSGALGELLGGGYSSFLVILPDYWSLPTPLNWGLALAALTTLLVAFGGRVAGRPGATVGALASTAGWALVVPVAPLGLALAFGAVIALGAGWLVWHRGLLTLAVASITGLALPTAWVSWRLVPWMLDAALFASAPVLILPLAFLFLTRAPRHGDAGSVVPAYVSQLQNQLKLEAQVDLLRDLQLSLLPPGCPPLPEGLEVAWRMVPADTVGGDFFDLVEDASGRLWLAMADVAGHGISCSVLTAFTKAAVAEHAVAEKGPAEALERIRRLFSRLRSQRTLVTLLLAVWDPRDRTLRVASAGHPPLLLWDGRELKEVGSPSNPLGVQLASEVREDCVPCHQGAVLVAYTDGVPEALSPRGEPFTFERWPTSLPGMVEESAEEILRRLLAEVDQHRQGHPAADDVTALVLKMGVC